MKDLSQYTSFRIGGPARQIITVTNESEIVAAVEKAESEGSEILILGAGTNMLISDAGFAGTVIQISNKEVESEVDACSGATLSIGAGENWDSFVETTISRGFAGLETLSGIPGTVGASPIQNIGAYGHEISEFIIRVRTYDRVEKKLQTFTHAECDFSYRSSKFKKEKNRFVILEVVFQLRLGEFTDPLHYKELANELGIEVGGKASVIATRAATLKLREKKGMLLNNSDHDSWSAGSFFVNPILSPAEAEKLPAEIPRWIQADGRVKVSAAWLMENAGVQKGDVHSGARISSKHVLALTNTGSATAADIAALAKEAREKVERTFGITLEAEVNLVGLTLN